MRKPPVCELMSPWPIGGSHRKARIFKASRGFEILLTKPSNEPYSSADFSQNVPRLLRASSNVSPAEERDLDDPAGLTVHNDVQIALYTPESGRPDLP